MLQKLGLATLGLTEEFRGRIAVNAMWPHTTTAASRIIVGGEEMMRRSRRLEIMADGGNFLIDDDVLRAHRTISIITKMINQLTSNPIYS